MTFVLYYGAKLLQTQTIYNTFFDLFVYYINPSLYIMLING